MEKKAKQGMMLYSADLASFLFNCAFFGVRAEILLSRNQGVLDSRAGPFLGYVQIYSFLEKYSPLKQCQRHNGPRN